MITAATIANLQHPSEIIHQTVKPASLPVYIYLSKSRILNTDLTDHIFTLLNVRNRTVAAVPHAYGTGP